VSKRDAEQAATKDAVCLASKQRGLDFNSRLLRYSITLSDSCYTLGLTSPIQANVQDRSNVTEMTEEIMKVAMMATKQHKKKLI